MPNHVETHYFFVGAPEQLDALQKKHLELCELDDSVSNFTFNAHIPKPFEIQNLFYDLHPNGHEWVYRPSLHDRHICTDEEIAALREQLGPSVPLDSLEWAREFWGTKWNAYQATQWQRLAPHVSYISFQTAWSFPLPVINKCAEEYDLTVLGIGDDEGDPGLGFEFYITASVQHHRWLNQSKPFPRLCTPDVPPLVAEEFSDEKEEQDDTYADRYFEGQEQYRKMCVKHLKKVLPKSCEHLDLLYV